MKLKIQARHRDTLRGADGTGLTTPDGDSPVVWRGLDLIGGLLAGQPRLAGLLFWAAGAGDKNWDAAGLPAVRPDTTGLVNEVYRQPLSASSFSYDATTRKLTVRATYPQDVANGELREMGLFGGDASALPGSGFLFSYRVHAVINKTATQTLERELTVDFSASGLLDSALVALAGLLSNTPDHTGIRVWAVGEGDAAWDAAPPGPPDRATANLRKELDRKLLWPVRNVQYDAGTHTVTAVAEFDYNEGRGTLRETGLFGGATAKQLIAYQTHSRIDKLKPLRLRREFRLRLANDKLVKIPPLAGKTPDEARTALAATGLIPGELREVENTAMAGKVIESSPAANTDVPAGSVVALSVGVPQRATVPNLVGISLTDAKKLLGQAGLTAADPEIETSEEIPGTVLRQKPAPGSRIPAAQPVSLTVATPPDVQVPDLKGATLASAVVLLERVRLRLADPPALEESDAPTATVIGQSPVAGNSTPRDSQVSVKLAAPRTIQVPDLNGKEPDEAASILDQASQQALKNLGRPAQSPALALGSQSYRESSMPAGTIIEQKPAAGDKAPLFSTVTIVLAAPPSARVPDVIGLSRADATTKITGAQLKLGTVTEQMSPIAAGTVTAQDPAAGVAAISGSAVNLTVSRVVEVEVPNLVGQHVSLADEVLKARGLKLGKLQPQAMPQPPTAVGTILSQNPAAGKMAAVNTEVALNVVGTATVPRVIDLLLDQAKAKLESVGLTMAILAQTPSEKPLTTVLAQDAAPDAKLPLGSPVNLTVAKGVLAPDVTGMKPDDAKAKLTAAQLQMSVAGQAESEKPEGTVVSQAPLPGVELPLKSTVAVTTAVGVPVPNLKGLTQAEATAKVQAARLRLRVGSSQASPDPVGNVLSQTPAADQKAPIASEAVVVVSAGGFATVPKLVGQNFRDAENALRALKLNMAVIKREQSDTVPLSAVISQNVPEGNRIPEGSTVGVTVSLGKDAARVVMVPDVTRNDLPTGQRLLAARGLQMQVGTPVRRIAATFVAGREVAAGLDVPLRPGAGGPPPPGPVVIIAQEPSPDTPVERGSVVTVWTGRQSILATRIERLGPLP